MGPCRINKPNLEESLPFQTLYVNLNTFNSFQEQPGIFCDFSVFPFGKRQLPTCQKKKKNLETQK